MERRLYIESGAGKQINMNDQSGLQRVSFFNILLEVLLP